MRITMKEIARLANVSVTTVSKVFNNRDMNISEATRKKILDIAAENNYVPNMMAKGLRQNQTSMLGIILPDITNPFFSTIARGVEDAASARGFGVIFSDTDNSPERERDSLNYLTSRMIDGIILIQTISPSSASYLPQGIPLVALDRLPNLDDMPDLQVGKVYTDTQRATYSMADLLISSGCRQLAYISAKPSSTSDRYFGFIKALEEHDLPQDERLIYFGGFQLETGVTGIESFISSGVPFDGVVCGNDLIAIGAISALKKSGISVPKHVKVTGLDDIVMASYTSPALTTADSQLMRWAPQPQIC